MRSLYGCGREMSRRELADRFAANLRELADLCDRVGNGDQQAASELMNHVDNYHHAICVGSHTVEVLCDFEGDDDGKA